MGELEKAIKKLEALRDEAYYKGTNHKNECYASNRMGQYTAYHKAVEIVKLAMRKDSTPGCVCCGEAIPEGRQVCPSCERGESDG
jgi:hypothetical protein